MATAKKSTPAKKAPARKATASRAKAAPAADDAAKVGRADEPASPDSPVTSRPTSTMGATFEDAASKVDQEAIASKGFIGHAPGADTDHTFAAEAAKLADDGTVKA